MYRSSFALAAAVAALTLSANARADDGSEGISAMPGEKPLTTSNGWYFAGSAGLSFLQEQHGTSGTINLDTGASTPGFDVTGALGKDLGHGFRAEGELGYRQINLSHATVYTPGGTGIVSGSAGGEAQALSVMGNGYYDFKNGTRFVPYIGAGIGFADVSMNSVTVNGVNTVNDDDLAFAYQGMAGIGYQLTENGTIFTGYRYFAVDDPSFTDSAGGKFHSDFETHNLEVGYRLSF